MSVIHGKYLVVTRNRGTYYEAIAASKSCDIILRCNENEVTPTQLSQWKAFRAGRKEWEVTCAFLVTSGTIRSHAAMVGTTVTLRFGTSSDYLTGSAIVTEWHVTGTYGNLAQGSFRFKGTGGLT